MQDSNTPEPDGRASLSRRNFITIAAAGAAATVPAVAFAEASGKSSRLPRPLDVQLDECVTQLRAILQLMHPSTEIHSHFLSTRQDGSFRFSMSGDPDFHGEYDGEGVYEICIDGYVDTFWLEKDCRRSVRTGEPIAGCEFYWAAYWEKGVAGEYPRQMTSPRIVRKLPGVAL